MVEVWSAEGRALLQRLLAEHPEWLAYCTPGVFSAESHEIVHPRLNIPSLHPTIRTPLTIELGGTLQLFWYEGYFYDFLGRGEDKVEETYTFLQRFFAEEIFRMVSWIDGKVVAGGPAEAAEFEEWLIPWPWTPKYDLIQFRSWRGTYDRDVPL